MFDESSRGGSAERAKCGIEGRCACWRGLGGFAGDCVLLGFGGGGFGFEFSGCCCGLVFLVFLRGGEVCCGDLQGVEDETGAAGVDVVVAEQMNDFAEGGLDGGPGVGCSEQEEVAAGLAQTGLGDGFAGVVVVVAEVGAAHGGAAAAESVGKDVAALTAFGFLLHLGDGLRDAGDGVLHLGDGAWHDFLPHWVKCVQSPQNKRPESGLRSHNSRWRDSFSGSGLCSCGLKQKARLAPGFSLFS